MHNYLAIVYLAIVALITALVALVGVYLYSQRVVAVKR